jgi:small-conductance mechanosensitive channel/CRP-like cAMP-binding protein
MGFEAAYLALGLLGAIVVVAALVNRFRPAHRAQVRRLVILYVLFVACTGTSIALRSVHEHAWAERFDFGADLLQAFITVNLAATLFFSLLLPATGVVLPMIAGDLLVGVGYIVTTFGVLKVHHVDLTGAVASATVVSAALVLSLQTTLGNILGGVALQLDGSIHEGDWVQLENGRQGKIRAIRWRHTVIETRDWSTMIVPNSQLLGAAITILGKREGRAVAQRMWVWFNVDFRHPPTKVIQAVVDGLVAAPIVGVAADPAPNCVCMDFTKDMRESFATYAVRYWLTDLAADDPTNSRVRTRIYTALQRAGIPLALPNRRMFLKMDDDAHAKAHTEREITAREADLRALKLFKSLTDEEIHTIACGLRSVIYTAGETITRQGAVAHWLYILGSGSVEVRTTVDPDGPEGPLPAHSKTVASLAAPSVFGEMGLMTGEPRSANVVAVTDVECFRLDKSTFEHVVLGRPEIAHELSLTLAERRAELIAIRDGLDEEAKKACEVHERERIRDAIKTFFGL